LDDISRSFQSLYSPARVSLEKPRWPDMLRRTGKKFIQRRRKPGGRVGQQIVDLPDLRGLNFVCRLARPRAQHLTFEELIASARYRRHLRAGAKKSHPGERRRLRSLNDALTVITVRIGVGDIVAGGDELTLRGIDAGQSDIEQAAMMFPRLTTSCTELK
jgi:hypothetical protein